MASVNKCIIVGNLGRDVEMRYMPNGEPVANLVVATTESWKDKNTGEKKEITEWHRITMYRKLAEIAGQYLKKGSQVYIEGRLQTRKWTDNDGVERYTTEIIADTMQMLGSRQGGNAPAEEYGDSAPAPRQNSRGNANAQSNSGYGNSAPAPRQSGAGGNGVPMAARGGMQQSNSDPQYDDDIPFTWNANMDFMNRVEF